jgi:hypothetical protein
MPTAVPGCPSCVVVPAIMGGEVLVDLSPFLTQPVKTRSSANGELSHGIVTQEVHKRVQVGGGQAA